MDEPEAWRCCTIIIIIIIYYYANGSIHKIIGRRCCAPSSEDPKIVITCQVKNLYDRDRGTDGQTDGRTDGQQRRAVHYMRRRI